MAGKTIGRATFRNVRLMAVVENLLALYDGLATKPERLLGELTPENALAHACGQARRRCRQFLHEGMSIESCFDVAFRMVLETNCEMDIHITPLGHSDRFDVDICLNEFVDCVALDLALSMVGPSTYSSSSFVLFDDSGWPWLYVAGDGPLAKSRGRMIFDSPSAIVGACRVL